MIPTNNTKKNIFKLGSDYLNTFKVGRYFIDKM